MGFCPALVLDAGQTGEKARNDRILPSCCDQRFFPAYCQRCIDAAESAQVKPHAIGPGALTDSVFRTLLISAEIYSSLCDQSGWSPLGSENTCSADMVRRH